MCLKFGFVGFVGRLLTFSYGSWDQDLSGSSHLSVNSPIKFFGKAIMYVIAVFTQHGNDKIVNNTYAFYWFSGIYIK